MLVSLQNESDAVVVADEIVPQATQARCIQGPASGLKALKRQLKKRGVPSTFGTGQWLYRLDEVART